MTFKNKKHAERFFLALANTDVDSTDLELMASIYILTSYKRIWKTFEAYLDNKNGICPEAFERFKPRNETEYALVSAAFDLLYCSDCINLTDLTDIDTIPDNAFLAIIHAIGYVRYGFEESEGSKVTELH